MTDNTLAEIEEIWKPHAAKINLVLRRFAGLSKLEYAIWDINGII
jgi:hypothetical protein